MQALFDNPVGQLRVDAAHKVLCLWLVLVIVYRRSSGLVDGKGNEKGLGAPGVV